MFTDLSSSTKEASRDRADYAKHNILRIEIRTTDSDQPAARLERNVSDKVFLDSYSSVHQPSEFLDSKDQAKYFYQPQELCVIL